MSRNGSGTYNLPAGNPVVTGTTISSTWANNTMNDIASALTGSVAADGQTPMTGDLNLNSNKIVNVDDPTQAQDAATKTYVDAKTDGTSAGSFTNLAYTGTLTGGTGVVNIGSGQIYKDASGNVGIGTSSPTTKLNVAGLLRSTSGSSSVDIGHDGTNGSITSTNSLLQYATGSNPIILHTNGSERMRIDSSGSVGIGTTSTFANTKLNVEEGLVARSSTGGLVPYLQLYNSNAGTDLKTWRTAGNPDGSMTFENVNDAYTSATERVRISPNGEVLIAGSTDQGAYNLQVAGTGVWGAGAYVNGSDERIKENITSLDSGLDVVAKLNPVTYKYKEDWSKDQSTQTGFIAQELLTALDGKNYIDGIVQQGGQYMSVAYQNIIPILTKAIQEQQAIINDLKARIKTLEAK